MNSGPFVRQTIHANPDDLLGFDGINPEPWQTEQFVNESPVTEQSHEYVLKKKPRTNAQD